MRRDRGRTPGARPVASDTSEVQMPYGAAVTHARRLRVPRRRRAVLVAAVLLGLAVPVAATGPAGAASTTVTVRSGSGPALHDDFIGLSFEASVLASPALTSGNLGQYMRTLGPGVMRF